MFLVLPSQNGYLYLLALSFPPLLPLKAFLFLFLFYFLAPILLTPYFIPFNLTSVLPPSFSLSLQIKVTSL